MYLKYSGCEEVRVGKRWGGACRGGEATEGEEEATEGEEEAVTKYTPRGFEPTVIH